MVRDPVVTGGRQDLLLDKADVAKSVGHGIPRRSENARQEEPHEREGAFQVNAVWDAGEQVGEISFITEERRLPADRSQPNCHRQKGFEHAFDEVLSSIRKNGVHERFHFGSR